jgi:hypothetical protein
MARSCAKAAVLVAVMLLTSSCASSASSADPSNKAAQDAARAGQPATSEQQFLPWLRTEIAKNTWPEAYTISAETIWKYTEPVAQDTILTQQDARDAVLVYSTCAWSLQLIDDVKKSRPITEDTSTLTTLSTSQPGSGEIVADMISEAQLGGVSKTQQYVKANTCTDGFTS